MIRKSVAAFAVAAVVALGACSDDGSQAVDVLAGDEAVAALRSAPDAAAEAGSGRMEMTVAFEAEGQSFEILAEGVFSGTQAQMEMDLGDQLAALAGGQKLPEGADEPMTIIVDGTTTYMKVPLLAAMLGGDGWYSVSAEDMGIAEDMLNAGGASSNPAQMLETLRGVSNEFEELGSDEVRGTAVQGYRVTIDMRKALAEVPAAYRDAFEQQMAGLPVDELPMDVWLDADNLVRRIEMNMSEIMSAAGADGAGQMTIDYFDYGSDVDIDIPDPSEVTPLSEVMGGLGG